MTTETAAETGSDRAPETTLAIACLLSLSGGFLDAFTWVAHGKVFANAMTGNIILMGVSATEGDWRQALKHLPPLIAFLIGVWTAQALRLPRGGPLENPRWPALLSLILEIAVLAVIAFLPRSFPDIWIVLAIAFAAAVQNSSFTKVGAWSYNSVVTTGNLRRFGETLFGGTVPRRHDGMLEQARVFGAICVAFLAGALIGGLGTRMLHNAALAIPVLVLGFVLWRLLPSIPKAQKAAAT
jgi:uncharacterized membrane protein YoaK (UPF0700 family)